MLPFRDTVYSAKHQSPQRPPEMALGLNFCHALTHFCIKHDIMLGLQKPASGRCEGAEPWGSNAMAGLT